MLLFPEHKHQNSGFFDNEKPDFLYVVVDVDDDYVVAVSRRKKQKKDYW